MAANEKPGKARRGVFPTILDETYAVPMTQPFWDAAKEDRLVAPRCMTCGTFRLPPAPFCWVCQAQEVDWVELPGTGTVYTYTVVRHPLHLALAYAGLPLYRSRITRNDAPASVRQAYTPEEVVGFFRLAGAADVQVQEQYLYRMGVLARKPQ